MRVVHNLFRIALVVGIALGARTLSELRFRSVAEARIREKMRSEPLWKSIGSGITFESETLHFTREDYRVRISGTNLNWTVNLKTGEIIPWHSPKKEEGFVISQNPLPKRFSEALD